MRAWPIISARTRMVVLWPDGTALHSTSGVDSSTACLPDEQILLHWEKSRFGPAYAQEAEDDEDDEVESFPAFVYIFVRFASALWQYWAH